METRPGRFKRGHTSPDRPGLVFYARIKDFEYWVTPEKRQQLEARQKTAMKKWLDKPGSREKARKATADWVKTPEGRKIRRKVTARYIATVEGTIINRSRARIYAALKQGHTKSADTLSLIGCTISQFKSHLESQFEDGMNWSNMGKWEIDHRAPLSGFNLSDPHQQRVAFNFNNCRPMWKPANRRKSDRAEGELFTVRQLKRANIIPFREVA